ncbi:acyl-CoA dehydrogenase family protein [Limimaricola sp.]|uniref:acyl-CoA dehydrogenase family protein n=1 Tax=Limimaricola sp. TaxID=2211665 RepID=UPI00405A045D
MGDVQQIDRAKPRDPRPAARALAEACAAEAAARDDDDSFVAGNHEKAKAAGLLDAGVPVALGGGGADIRALCDMLREVAHGCASTALALSMHTHQVAFPAWRWHHQPQTRDKTEPLLRRIAAERLVLLSSGGGDWIGGSGKAEPVAGGYKVTARKMFVSGAPAGDLLMTSAISPEEGGTVIHFPCPMGAAEVSILDTWHTLGMRGTGSHDVMIEAMFVPAEKVAVKRPQGHWHPVFFILATVAFPLIYAVYLGVAERARDLGLGIAARRSGSARLRDRAGRMETALAAARMAHRHMVETAEANAPSAETVNQVMIGRRLVEEHAIRTVELAMELAGGAGFYRKAELERLFRDIQAARYHPLQKEAQSEYAGALALGQSAAEIY